MSVFIGLIVNFLILDRGTDQLVIPYNNYGDSLQIQIIYYLSGRCKFGSSQLRYGSAILDVSTAPARCGLEAKIYGRTTCTIGIYTRRTRIS